MVNQSFKKWISFVVVLVLALGCVSFASANEVEYDVYNITENKGYTNPLTNEQIKEINLAAMNGAQFAKKISNKLVNYNDYYQKLIKVYTENMELPEDEIIEKIIEEISTIVEGLPAVTPEIKPTLVSAKFYKQEQEPLSKFGFVTIEVKDLDAAAKFSVEYKVDGGWEIVKTEIVAISEEAGLVFYDGSNTVNIEIFNEASESIHTFKDVQLETIE